MTTGNARLTASRRSVLRRIQAGLAVFSAIGLVAVFGYRFFGGYDWIEACWMVVITISTVGFGEQSQLSSGMQLFSMAVIVLGVTAAAYTFGAFMQLAIEGRLEQLMGLRKMTREIQQLRDHVIICGFGRTGELLADSLRYREVAHVIIDHDEGRSAMAQARGHLTVEGDATEDHTLQAASIERADSLVTCLPNDAQNVFITLTARNLCPGLRIVARAEQPSTEQKLKQAGASRVVLPAAREARLMERMVTRPTTADFAELVEQRKFRDLELDEIHIGAESSLVGMDVRSTELGRKHKLLVVAVTSVDGTMTLNPDTDYVFRPDDVVIVIGGDEDITRFRTEFQVA
jgi:voltage-gated potassium channel